MSLINFRDPLVDVNGSSALTRPDPILQSEFMPAWNVDKITPWIASKSAQTITSGSMKAWTWNDDLGKAMRVPELDLAITEAGRTAYSWQDRDVGTRRGGVLWVPTSIVMSGADTQILNGIMGWSAL
jgi:hypothetical protein